MRRAYYSGKTDFEFVERSRIRDVIINEGVRHTTVSYYLAIMVRCPYYHVTLPHHHRRPQTLKSKFQALHSNPETLCPT